MSSINGNLLGTARIPRSSIGIDFISRRDLRRSALNSEQFPSAASSAPSFLQYNTIFLAAELTMTEIKAALRLLLHQTNSTLLMDGLRELMRAQFAEHRIEPNSRP